MGGLQIHNGYRSNRQTRGCHGDVEQKIEQQKTRARQKVDGREFKVQGKGSMIGD
jgi:hypothetical protein